MRPFRVRVLATVVLSGCLLVCQGAPDEVPPTAASAVLDFNAGWRFTRGDVPEASDPRFDDTAWRLLNLPHDWGIEGPFDPGLASATGYLPAGIGWYRKSFTREPDGDRRTLVRFEAIQNNSSVWINGHHLGDRPNGYISFEYDITPHLRQGRNVLSVRVDHSKYLDSRWYNGSGIYGRVFLIERPPVHFRTWSLFVTTPEITADAATVRVDAIVSNTTDHDGAADLAIEVRGRDGAPIASGRSPVRLAPGTDTPVRVEALIPDPTPWSPEDPHLYSLTATLTRAGNPIDVVEIPLGVRTFRFDPDDGFYLNGRRTILKGVCLHHDAGALGAAVPRDVWARRLRILKEAGTNAIRLSHNPATPHLLDLADEMGFLVMGEAFDEWEFPKNKWRHGWNQGEPGHDGYHEHFNEWADRDLRDMILRDRNHPSIILWSIGNEIDYPNDPYSHPILGEKYDATRPDASRLGDIATRLVSLVKELDGTRPVTAALASTLMSNETGFPSALDVVGYNYQEDRYLEDRKRYPDRVIYGSENKRHYTAWKAVLDHEFVAGQFLWIGIDYLGESRPWPARNSVSGIIDLAGFARARYFFRKSFWTEEPMIHLATSGPDEIADRALLHWNWDEPGKPIKVYGITNADRVELLLNGRSLGEKRREEFIEGSAEWIVPFEPGTLEAVARDGIAGDGAIVARHALRTAGTPSAMRVEVDRDDLRANGEDVAHIEVTIEDSVGTRVPNAEDRITCTVSGPARLIGMESGNPESHEDYRAHARRVYRGRLLIYVQAGREPGEAVVMLDTDRLEARTIRLRVR